MTFSLSERFLLDSICTYSLHFLLRNSILACVAQINPNYHSIQTVFKSLVTSLSVNKRGLFSTRLYGHSAIHCVDHGLSFTAFYFPGSYDCTVFLIFSHLAGSSLFFFFLISFAGSFLLPSNCVSEFLKASTFAHSSFNPIHSSRHLCFYFSYLCRCQ